MAYRAVLVFVAGLGKKLKLRQLNRHFRLDTTLGLRHWGGILYNLIAFNLSTLCPSSTPEILITEV